MKRTTIMVILCAALLLTMTACFKPSQTKVETGDSASTTQPTETRVTVPVPEGLLSFETLMTTVDSDTQWSELVVYEHTAIDDTHASFTVQNSSGKQCTLTVTFDAAADKVTEAVLSHGNQAVDILTDDNTVALRSIMVAMNNDESER